MKFKYLTFCLILGLVFVSGCNPTSSKTTTETTTPTPTPKLTEVGPFYGTLPCTDCAGIETVLTLYFDPQTNEPVKYFANETYVNQTSPLSSQGKFIKIDKDGKTLFQIEPEDSELSKYYLQVNENTLRQLDRNGNEFANKTSYELKK